MWQELEGLIDPGPLGTCPERTMKCRYVRMKLYLVELPLVICRIQWIKPVP